MLPSQWGDGGTDVIVVAYYLDTRARPGAHGRPAATRHGLPGLGRLQPCGDPRARHGRGPQRRHRRWRGRVIRGQMGWQISVSCLVSHVRPSSVAVEWAA